jgi:hypothetical protein
MSDYTDAQTWVGGGGLCVAGATTGSSNAICADGYELAGHVTPTCGTSGTSAFLSVGGAAINANPCAAGKAPQPVPSRSTNLPPEPNSDPLITATLPGGTACAAGAVYPNIVVNGVTVGTGNAAAPTQDAGGFVHFKKGCYGYLNLGNLGSAAGVISNVQVGPETVPSKTTVTPTLTAASTLGTLLVVTLRSETSVSNKPFTAPPLWLPAGEAFLNGTAHTQIWYYPSNPGGITNADFGVSPASLDAFAQMSEWSGVAAALPLDQAGTATISTAQPNATISTSGPTTTANELVITDIGVAPAVPGNTYTPGAGWTSMTNDPNNGFGSEYRLNVALGLQSETVTYTSNETWAMVIATFKPAPGGAPPNGAVLDPGFYYFNGSGFAGGGGICLNGGVLLAKDVTLEFVNQAGFSTGSCTAGGAPTCTGTCKFGSTPCSISACPPNALPDSVSGGYTWFAAPCSQAPPGDASCGGSAWCPVGDRACWNLLIWAPAGNTGQVSIAGTFAKAWLLGSAYWPGTCAYTVNGTTSIAGALSCGSLSISAGAGAGTAVGSDYGIGTALAEAVLIE